MRPCTHSSLEFVAFENKDVICTFRCLSQNSRLKLSPKEYGDLYSQNGKGAELGLLGSGVHS